MYYSEDLETSNGIESCGLGMSDAAKPPQPSFLR